MAGIASTSSSSSEDLASDAPQQVEPVDCLLQRRRCELMYELKKLQHGDKPVTGTESRENVDKFFTKRQQTNERSIPVANVDDVEEHRPQQVTIEVQGLLQRRSVSSVLQSAGFRRSLERVVRSHLGPSPQTTAPTRTRASSLATTAEVPTQRTDSPSQNTQDSGPESINSSVSEPLSLPIPPPPPPALHPQPQQPFNPEDRFRRWNEDEFVMEISELVHRQLVSSTLQGHFRDRLENLVMSRVSEAGHDGQAVMETIQSLPRSNIRHNDFSHLGINTATRDQIDLDDAISVISATASASIPYAQSTAAVQREMSTMRSQISQLTNMLKKSLELQVDIQRSIKQEVAAAMNQTTASQQMPSGVRSRRAADTKCIVCIEGDSDAVLYRCGHICLCYSCALRMKSENSSCPVCRAPIVDVVRAYRISSDL